MRLIISAAVTAALLTAAAPAAAADREARDRVVAGLGTAVVDGQQATVEVFVRVPAGASAKAVRNQALRDQGAKPVENEYTFTGLRWDNLPVRQYYNGFGAPFSIGNALTATHGTWGSANSRFGMSYGGTTNRCPSIVRECRGPQVRDGFNDVGWTRLSGSTLGVTWSTSNPDEADMAIDTDSGWSLGCSQQNALYDLQTVFLHENGHVAGLGHSNDRNAIMYPSYQTARCTLGTDDVNGIRALYPR